MTMHLSHKKVYWHYQNQIKKSESNLGAVIGVPGAMFAMRSSDAFELEQNTINDDFVLSMKVLGKGGKAVLDEDVVIYERDCDSQSDDYTRRVRLGAGNWQQIKALMILLNPRLGWTFLNYFSHKVLRGVMPIILAIIYASIFFEAFIAHIVGTSSCNSYSVFTHYTYSQSNLPNYNTYTFD